MKQIIELVKRIKGSGRSDIIQHSKLMDMAESLVKGYDGSWRELALIGDRIENLGKKIESMELKEVLEEREILTAKAN